MSELIKFFLTIIIVVAGLRNLSSHDAPKHALKLQPEQQRVSSFFPIDSNNTFATDFPLSEGNLSNIVLYDGKKVRGLLSGPQVSTNEDYNELASEWIRVLDSGPGVLVVKDAFPDHELLDQVTTAFEEIIKEEEEENEGVGDHFSAAGNNSRIWNAQVSLTRIIHSACTSETSLSRVRSVSFVRSV